MDYRAISITLLTAIAVYIYTRTIYHIGYMARVRDEKIARGIN